MESFRFPFRQAGRLIAAAGLAASLTGCGWTSRDEFLARHSGATIQSQPGDGSRLETRLAADPFRAQSGKVIVRSQDGLDR